MRKGRGSCSGLRGHGGRGAARGPGGRRQMLSSCRAAKRPGVRGATPRWGGGAAGGGGSVSLRCHPPQRRAGIRLELTAEDIQLDCACHSVASIRASPRAFVFAVQRRAGEPSPASFCVISIYVDLQLRTSLSLSLSPCLRPPAPPYMLNTGVTWPWKSSDARIVGFVSWPDPYDEPIGK